IYVKIDGLRRPVPDGVTVARVRRVFALRPRPGALLDIEGVPLERRKYPGHLTLNGKRVSGDAVLRSGDVLEVFDGRDRYEPLSFATRRVSGGRPENPQTVLGTTPGQTIITTGAESGKFVSSVFRPTGGARVPNAVSLTFDDGPSPRYTPAVLRVLRRQRVRATFFVVGYLARRYPDIVRRLEAARMQVGNHSLSHPNAPPFATLATREIERQIAAGAGVLEDLGIEPTVFRPPGGSWSNAVVAAAEARGQRTVLWTVDSRDWAGLPAGAIAERVVSEARPGSIVLLHDGGGNRAPTLQALPRIIRGIRAKGLSFSVL
ncbi:MAG TPA: polysaccharide deacetylase family protein, partial [Actinomycetota bacterium]|nr:polysaccharide deacetylase family protein [Actinomycetota bacterium]